MSNTQHLHAWFEAAKACSVSGLRAFLEHETDAEFVNEKDTYGFTALMYAVCQNGGHQQCVDFLLTHGADPSCTDAEGRSVIEIGYAGVTSALERMIMTEIEKRIQEHLRAAV